MKRHLQLGIGLTVYVGFMGVWTLQNDSPAWLTMRSYAHTINFATISPDFSPRARAVPSLRIIAQGWEKNRP